MRRRLCSALTVLVLTSGLGLAVGGAADAVVVTTTTGGVTYRADDSAPAAGASVVSVDGTAPKALVLPTTVAIAGTTYDVTSVGAGAAEALDLTSLTLPARLVTVGESAFLGNQLTTLTLPGTVTSVGNAAFTANALTSLSLSASLLSIGEGAFAGNQLTSAALPAALKVIDSGAFVSNKITTVTFPASVTVIDDAAFADNPLTAAAFAGPPPTTFSPATPAGGSPIGSLGDGTGLTVTYPAQFAAPGFSGGYTSPTWQGYAAVAQNVTTPPPVVPPVKPGTARADIAKSKSVTGRNGVTRVRVTVTNTGTAAAQKVRVRFKNKPAGVRFARRKVAIGTLAPGARESVVLKVRSSLGRSELKVIVRSSNAPKSTVRVAVRSRRHH